MPVPPHLVDDWPVWRVVLAGMATLHEIDSHWTILDVLAANDVLDLKEMAEAPEPKR